MARLVRLPETKKKKEIKHNKTQTKHNTFPNMNVNCTKINNNKKKKQATKL